MMRITIETDQYNERRLGRPWIAVVASWESGQRPELRWGSWIGRDGCAGMLEIEARPGDILRWGQKDHRRPQNSRSEWAVVLHTGRLRDVSDVSAREYYLRIRTKGYYHTEIERQEEAIACAAINAARRAWIEEIRRASAERYTGTPLSAPAQESVA